MGNYIDKAAMITVYGEKKLNQLADLENTGTGVDARIDSAILRAEEIVDSYVSRRYDLSLIHPDPPHSLIDCSLVFALYLLYEGSNTTLVKELRGIRDAYDLRVEWLEKLVDKKVSLNDPITGDETATKAQYAHQADPLVFTRSAMKGY